MNNVFHLNVRVLRSTGYDAIPDTRRVAVAVDTDVQTLMLATLTGQALDARLLQAVLAATVMDAGFLSECVRRHRSRAHPYAVERYIGMSGCREYRVRYQRNAALSDAGVGGKIHVSMAGKLNEGLSVALMDLPPLLAAVYADFGQLTGAEAGPQMPDSFTLHPATPFEPAGWATAGDESDVYQELLNPPAAAPTRATPPSIITVAWLREQGACEDGIRRFEAAFPAGLNIEDREAAALVAVPALLIDDIHWFTGRYPGQAVPRA